MKEPYNTSNTDASKPGSGTPVTAKYPQTITPAQAFSIACLADLSGAAAAVSAPICTPPTTTPVPTKPTPANVTAGPAGYAVQFWKTIPLPVPKPQIPPGYAITGKTAYLVTNGTTDPPVYSDNTPLGQLTIQATGEYVVDWGDSSPSVWDGPYAMEGQPWPNGKITHTYDYTGTYTVQVVEDWSAVWRLGASTGELTGLHTAATIPDFRVEQLQAVITN